MYFKSTISLLAKPFAISLLLSLMISCNQQNPGADLDKKNRAEDSLAIRSMISTRERAMIDKNLELALAQFSEQATWINSQGYYFKGKEHIRQFHKMLAGNDSLDYFYEAGQPRIRMIDKHNALAYYGWKMFWFKKESKVDTTFKEIGLMTLSAHKKNNKWLWVAVTNQHTPWFYSAIEAVSID